MYQVTASVVVVGWSKLFVHFIDTLSDYNVTVRIVHSPVFWRNDTDVITATGALFDLPAIIITIAIIILLIYGIRQTATVNLILVVLKIIILLIFIFACYKYINISNYAPFFPPNEGTCLFH